MPKDLSNPVFLDKQLNDIVAATPNAAAELFVYCIWNVEDRTKPNISAAGLSVLGGGRSFTDDGLPFGSDVITQVFGHEVGRAMGLPDVTAGEDRLMFRAKRGSLRLVEAEIDKINPSGVGSP